MAAVLDIPFVPKAPNTREVKVLHIVENLQDRAVEAWLLRTFECAITEYPHIKWTFFCILGEPGDFDERVRSAGGEVIHSPHRMHDRLSFIKALRNVIQIGNYDVLHCHHDITSGVYLLASLGLPLQKRIVHLHNTSLDLPTPSRIKTRLLRRPLRQLCLRADHVVGSSNDALSSILGSRRRRQDRDLVVHYGIDTKRFKVLLEDRAEWHDKLGLAPDAKVLLFVGRLVDYKNPVFAVEVLERLRNTDPSFELLMAGIGPLSESIRVLAADRGLGTSVHLVGFREDVPTLMLQSDVLIWPSIENPKEGLGLGIVEAQAAGLPVLMSKSVPDEAVVIPELVRVLPLSAGASTWSEAIKKMLVASRPSRDECLSLVAESSFSLKNGVTNLLKLYEGLD